MCLKVGGWVRQQVGYGVNGSLTAGASVANQDSPGTQNFAMRSRGYITADARNQTEYGTVRSYIAVGLSSSTGSGVTAAAGTVNGDAAAGGNTFSSNRAFIQFAGFTFGLTQSFYDFYSGPATSFFGGNINMSSDTGDAGNAVTAYTAQFGNGLSATIGIEAQRNAPVVSSSLSAITSVVAPTSSQRGEQYPDIVANLRLDQAWGGAQVMAAIHDASGQYVGGATNAFPSAGTATGYALGAGLKLNAPMIGPGDYFQGQINYTVGASSFTNNSSGLFAKFNGTSGYGFGLAADNVYSAAGNNLTTAWGVNAAYEHFWNKSWQTSVYTGYQAFTYNSTANTILCSAEATAFGGLTSGTCNNNWAIWNVGSRTQWNIDSQTAMGVDIVYQKIQTASGGATYGSIGATSQLAGPRTIADQGSWMGQFRIHRSFYP